MIVDTPKRHETAEEAKKRNEKVAAASVVGSMLEWYDFYLYATMASIVFSHVFFDKSDPMTATLLSFATFSIGFVARPIGGMFFGHFGDLYGRKKMLVITFCLMGTCTALIGLIPTYQTIGVAAPILLVIVRIIQGFGAGAELAGAAVTTYEHADKNHKGRQGAWPALGLNLGLLLSSLTILLLSLGGHQFLINGGWRIPFLLSILLVAVGIWVRASLPETPEFIHAVKEKHPKVQFSDVFKHNLNGLAVVFFLAVGYNALSYIFKTFSLSYLTTFKGVTEQVTSLSVLIASFIAIFAVPLFGWLCDRWSSKTLLMIGGCLSVLFAYPFMALLKTGDPMQIYIAVAIGTGILAPMMFAPQGSFLSRQFPVNVRSAGVGTGREIGTAVAGGLAPLGGLALVAKSPTHSVTGVIIILAVAAVIVVMATLCDQGSKYTKDKN